MAKRQKPTEAQRKDLAKRTLEARNRLGISQDELGFIIGVCGSTISNIENEKEYSIVMHKVVSDWINEQQTTRTAAPEPTRKPEPERYPDRIEVLSGKWNGIPITYHNPYRGHYITEEEWRALCSGRTVILRGCLKYNKETGTYDQRRRPYDMAVRIEVPEGTTRVSVIDLAYINYPEEIPEEDKPQLIVAPDPEHIRKGFLALQDLLQGFQEVLNI